MLAVPTRRERGSSLCAGGGGRSVRVSKCGCGLMRRSCAWDVSVWAGEWPRHGPPSRVMDGGQPCDKPIPPTERSCPALRDEAQGLARGSGRRLSIRTEGIEWCLSCAGPVLCIVVISRDRVGLCLQRVFRGPCRAQTRACPNAETPCSCFTGPGRRWDKGGKGGDHEGGGRGDPFAVGP